MKTSAVKYIKIINYAYIASVVFLLMFFLRRGADFAFHMQRLNAIAEEFKMSGGGLSLPIRLYHTTLNNYGYASPMFYGDIFMYPFALLVVCGVSLLNAYKIMYICILFAIFFSLRFSLRMITQNETAIEIGTFIYMVSPATTEYILGSILGRDFALIFVPLVISALYAILNKPVKFDWLYLALGMAGLIFSNVLETVISAWTLFALLVFCIKKLDGRKVGKILLAAVVCLCLCLWFIAPMLEQMASQGFFVSNPEITQNTNSLSRHTVPLIGLVLPLRAVKVLYRLLGQEPPFGAYLWGLSTMLAVAAAAVKWRKTVLRDNFYRAALALLVFFILFQTKLFPHEATKQIFGVMQFPLRTQTVMTFICALLGMKLYEQVKGRPAAVVLIMGLVVANVAVLLAEMYVGDFVHQLDIARPLAKDPSYSFNSYDFTSMDVGAGEYLPDKLLKVCTVDDFDEFIEERGEQVICTNPNTKVSFERDKGELIVSYSQNSESSFELPLLMYKGYRAQDLATGEDVPLESSEIGLVAFRSGKEEGQVKVWYAGTPLQKISDMISLAGAALLCLYLVIIQAGKRTAQGTFHGGKNKSMA